MNRRGRGGGRTTKIRPGITGEVVEGWFERAVSEKVPKREWARRLVEGAAWAAGNPTKCGFRRGTGIEWLQHESPDQQLRAVAAVVSATWDMVGQVAGEDGEGVLTSRVQRNFARVHENEVIEVPQREMPSDPYEMVKWGGRMEGVETGCRMSAVREVRRVCL